MEVILVTEGASQKLRDLGMEEETGLEGETVIWFLGSRRIPKTDERTAEPTRETANGPQDGAGDER